MITRTNKQLQQINFVYGEAGIPTSVTGHFVSTLEEDKTVISVVAETLTLQLETKEFNLLKKLVFRLADEYKK